MEGSELVEAWRATLGGLDKSWVLFENGTCIVFTEPGPDLITRAKAILREFGRAGDASEIGDFAAAIPLDDGRGWLVAGRHSDIVTFVSRDEVAAAAQDAAIGRIGRAKREQDTKQLRVMHVEEKGRATAKGHPKQTFRPRCLRLFLCSPGRGLRHLVCPSRRRNPRHGDRPAGHVCRLLSGRELPAARRRHGGGLWRQSHGVYLRGRRLAHSCSRRIEGVDCRT